VGYGLEINLDPISEKGMGVCFMDTSKHFLWEIITKYEPFAIDLMNREIQKRNVKRKEVAKFGKTFLEKEENLSLTESPYCP
jgi:hypothetical protein